MAKPDDNEKLKRMELKTQAKTILDANDYNKDMEDHQKVFAKGIFDNQSRAALRKALVQMAECDTNFMSFKDDKNFLKHADETMKELNIYAALSPVLQDMKENDYEAINNQLGGKLPSLKKMRDKSNLYTYTREYVQSKLEMMSTDLYVTHDLDEDAKKNETDLKSLRDTAKSANKTDEETYYKANLTMKKAKDLGIKQTYTIEDRKAGLTWGNSGRTHHRWKVQIGTLQGKYDLPKKEDFKDSAKRWKWFTSLDASSKATVMKYAQLTEEDVAKGKVQEMKGPDLDKLYDNLLEVNKDVISGTTKGKVAKASYKYKNGRFNFDINGSVVGANASGKIGAGFKGGKLWEAGAKATIDVSGAIAQGRIKMGYNWENFGVNAKVQGKFLTGSAQAYGGIGRFTYTDDKGENQSVVGAMGMLSAQAAVAEAKGNFGITICGVKIGGCATVQGGGFGGTIGGFANTKGIGCSFGALLGLGFRLDLSIDWGGFSKWWQKRKEKQAMKKAQRDEMERRNQERRARAALKGKGKKVDSNKKAPDNKKDANNIPKVVAQNNKGAKDDNDIVRKTTLDNLKKKIGGNKKEDINNVQRSFTNRLGGAVKGRGSKVDDNRKTISK